MTPTRNGNGNSSEKLRCRREIFVFSPSGHVIDIASEEPDVDDEPVAPRVQAQPSSSREETTIQEEGSWAEARHEKRARTVDGLVDHSDAPLPPARKVQKLSDQSGLPRLPSASEQGQCVLWCRKQRSLRKGSAGRAQWEEVSRAQCQMAFQLLCNSVSVSVSMGGTAFYAIMSDVISFIPFDV